MMDAYGDNGGAGSTARDEVHRKVQDFTYVHPWKAMSSATDNPRYLVAGPRFWAAQEMFRTKAILASRTNHATTTSETTRLASEQQYSLAPTGEPAVIDKL